MTAAWNAGARVKRDCACPRARHVHGTEAAYSLDGCRCLPCALARHRYVRALATGQQPERQTRPIHGTRLRLQALTAIGYSPPELARMLNTSTAVVQRLRSGHGNSGRYGDDATVLLRTHHAVTALYDLLWDTPSSGPHALRLRNLATRHGWLPPLALDDERIDDPAYIPSMPTADVLDEIAIDEAMRGRDVRLTEPEHIEAVRRLTNYGHSAQQIADILGESRRTVQRRRAAA